MLQRRGFWLWLSVGLHAVVLLLGWWLARREVPKKKLPPVEMALVVTPAEVAKPVVVPPQPTEHGVRKASTTSAVKSAPADREVQQKTTPSESLAPREVRTGGLVIAGMDRPQGVERGLEALESPSAQQPFGDDGLDEKTRVQARLSKEVEAFMVRQHTSHGARGTVASLRRTLREQFEPSPSLVDKIPGSAEATKRVFMNAAEARNRPSAVATMGQSIVPAQQEIERTMLMPKTDPCSASHEIGRRESRFRVEHDSEGQASQYRLTLSSGDPAFDAYAQEVLRRSQATHLTHNPEEPPPVFSEWALAQVVYDWASTPTCYDPSFRPPGRPVYPDRKNPWAVTFTAEVSLLAVRYGR